jgi:hypothetical protein
MQPLLVFPLLPILFIFLLSTTFFLCRMVYWRNVSSINYRFLVCYLHLIIFTYSRQDYLTFRVYYGFSMLELRSCHNCGRQVRLSLTIETPLCPACRLASLPPIIETRLCLGCRAPIPTLSYLVVYCNRWIVNLISSTLWLLSTYAF